MTTPGVSVMVLVWRRSQLLLLRRPGRAEWAVPDGRAAFGESVSQAAVRLLTEQTGLRARPWGPAGVIEVLERDAAAVQEHAVMVAVSAEFAGGTFTASAAAEEGAWFEPAELPEPLEPRLQQLLRSFG